MIGTRDSVSWIKAEVYLGKRLTIGMHFLNLMKDLNLVDIYRTIHPNTRTYTYESKSLKLKSRIDFFLVSKQLINYVINQKPATSIAPDHKAIFLNFKIASSFKLEPGTWKFNNSLLEDEIFFFSTTVIKNSYASMEDKYKDVESKQLIKMEIRSKTISYSKTKKFNMKTAKPPFNVNWEKWIKKYVMTRT